ncbi:uncharacterized protein LOC122039739 [Zingiber officinale]|uniref:Uncharacterized protein n=1 Tax=Zingiber officinale TaxID=94328 RepID=A0A8J5LP77_ZINOF|nr:uncharacterized protein LOC122039739 [Zingiber officinale]KAG6528065.1 hypothetical protein ZIOFF_010213 [Zingiber officinale]
MECSGTSGDLKRRRAEEEMPSPGTKRLREDLLFDDDDEGEDTVAGEQDIASVMKSLEEEISLPEKGKGGEAGEQPDLGFLLEASDDELGLPPPPAASSSSEEAAAAPAAEAEAEAEAVWFGQMWELADDFDEYYGMGEFAGLRPEERPVAEAEEVTGFDLFDFADSLWPSESLPAN